MASSILQSFWLSKEKAKSSQFLVVFSDYSGKESEFIFYDNSLAQCVLKCAAFIEYMFRYKYMIEVYIFPTNSTTTFRNVYHREEGGEGQFKMLQCPKEQQLSMKYIRANWRNY